MKPLAALLMFLLSGPGLALPFSSASSQAVPLTSVDRTYLRDLARDTWRCIAGLENPETGLPYDNSDKGEFTSVSNIGFYLSSVAAAERLGFIRHAEAVSRLKKTLASVLKLQTWHGFQQCWNSVLTLQPATHDTAISVLDTGNLAASLLAVSQMVPEVKDPCLRLFRAMEWKWFYDPVAEALFGGYDTKTGVMNPQWHLSALGTDAELALFLAVASDQAPPAIWNKLDTAMEARYGFEYLKPGWQGGGLFMQFISGIWLDNRGTLMERSAKAFAAAQIEHARRIGSPVWGWSASDDPAGGYLGWGGIKDEVVTPHASVLAIDFFLREVLDNLRTLEKMGTRSADRGFYDAVNVKTRERSKKFLMLDQGMLFLSLANSLEKDAVRVAFQQDPIVRIGRRRIAFFGER